MVGVHRGFPPIAGPDARILILGSLPGAESLARSQYYANPRNSFWHIMGELFDAGPDLPYPERCERLVEHGVAVWDVLGAGMREGSLDSAIELTSAVPNDFAAFFESHPHLGYVYFNGAAAESLFRRLVAPTLSTCRSISYARLPSTSPAHASLDRAAKLAAWRQISERS